MPMMALTGIQALRTWLLPAEAEAVGLQSKRHRAPNLPPSSCLPCWHFVLSTLSSSSLKSALGWELLSSSGTM